MLFTLGPSIQGCFLIRASVLALHVFLIFICSCFFFIRILFSAFFLFTVKWKRFSIHRTKCHSKAKRVFKLRHEHSMKSTVMPLISFLWKVDKTFMLVAFDIEKKRGRVKRRPTYEKNRSFYTLVVLIDIQGVWWERQIKRTHLNVQITRGNHNQSKENHNLSIVLIFNLQPLGLLHVVICWHLSNAAHLPLEIRIFFFFIFSNEPT